MRIKTLFRIILLLLAAFLTCTFFYGSFIQPLHARKEGRKWAIIVGIDKYQNQITELNCATNDAKEFRKTLIDASGFKDDNIFLLTSEEKGNRAPQKGYIVQWISYVIEKSAPEDTFVFFFSGHGSDMEKESYLLTMDANSFSAATLDATALKVSDLKKYLAEIKAETILMFIDACRNDPRSGKGEKDNLLTDNFSKSLTIKGATSTGGSAPFSATFFSCQVGQRSYEWAEKSMGFFTYYLINGLKGEARDSKGAVTINSLEQYLGSKVSSSVEKERGNKQDPWVSRSGSSGGGEMILALAGKATLSKTGTLVETAKPVVTVTVTPKSTVTVTATIQPTATGGSGAAFVNTPRPTPTSALPHGAKEERNPKDDASMVLVPAGEFLMGSPQGEGQNDELPQRRVYLDAFQIYRHEVTNDQFARFAQETAYQTDAEREGWSWVFDGSNWIQKPGTNWRTHFTKNTGNHPVICVTWFDATAYCRWAGVRLPTEAEWEKAARGIDGRRYPWGNTWDERACNWANCQMIAGLAYISCGKGTMPVGSFPSGVSPCGAYDMAGNVWEWCSDFYSATYYGSGPSKNPLGPPTGSNRVARGGTWINGDPSDLRCARRDNLTPVNRCVFKGFRGCRSVSTR
jgi:formylglycine-generating enzyme